MSFSFDHEETDARVWPAFTDVLMTLCLILVFFLFAQIVASSLVSAEMAEVDQRKASLHRAVDETIPPRLRHDIRITEDLSLQRYTFADWVLFDTASAELKPSGMEVLTALGEVFRRHAREFSNLQIAGHTDDKPLHPGARFASNWELSSARATSVVRFFVERCGIDPKLLSATGYSEYQPADPGKNEEARAHNRRIEVVVVYSARKTAEGARPEARR